MIEYMRGIFGRTCWSLRMRYWLWQEKRTLARLKSLLLGLLPHQDAAHVSSFGTCIPEVAGDLRSPPRWFADGNNLIEALWGERSLEDQSVCHENPRRTLTEREARLIAEYDAHFLASTRIKVSGPPLFR
jgi:hypothetical protein